MSFVNNYKSIPTSDRPTYGPDPYDVNFVFPVLPSSLESTRIKLTPFIPKLHAASYRDATAAHQDLYDFLPFSMPTLDSMLLFTEGMRCSPGKILFAIIDKTGPGETPPHLGGSFAGIIGLNNANIDYLSIDIGPIVVFPAFQRTHVASHSVGLLLQYCMELPDALPNPGLGLRRVTWLAKPDNPPSIRLAEKMGFVREGVLRWTYVTEAKGMRTRDGDPDQKPGRDCLLLTMTCEDWDTRGKFVFERQMNR
ncbi:acyl-CoA N-acyltransferase [Calocera viscosa TUFC12733]|uniref:Acyl-CoA N-acyltransferase n=1 Tax=Calocera viscosa (strain TUFC12733) TaxID=1330018 RepID=A0A167QL32_CALVF|nr:acyl-CoA N-acyltransferase [Calocera viscosa TUFC12733]